MGSEAGDNNFPQAISKLLKDGNTVQALSLFTDNKNTDEVYHNSWDLIPIITTYLTKESEFRTIHVFKCAQKLLDVISEQSKPEDAVLQFVEEIETTTDETKFVSLLQPLEKVLLRLPDKRLTSLAWCFNAITQFLRQLNTPDDYGLIEEEERLLLDASDEVSEVTAIYSEILPICATFIKELKESSVQNPKKAERRDVLTKFFIDLLGKPLACLHLNTYKGTKSRAREIADVLIEHISSLNRDPYSFLAVLHGKACETITPNPLALGVFYYVVFCQNSSNELVPKIYNPIYIFQKSLTVVVSLLTSENQFLIESGVDLTTTLLKSISKGQLPYLLLDEEIHAKFCRSLSNVIIYNQALAVRQKGLQLLHNYIWAFEHQGRYAILINLMPTLTHSGLKGNLITLYKEMLREHLPWDCKPIEINKYYCGQKLFGIIDVFTFLNEKEASDLVEESDRIVAALNFLRYIILADTTGATFIDCHTETIGDNFLSDLKRGIMLSKEHYQLRIKELKDPGFDEKAKSAGVSVTVSGSEVLESSNEEKVNILNLCMTTLDVMESLLGRLELCIDQRNKLCYPRLIH